MTSSADTRITVAGGSPYDVVVGHGLGDRLTELLRRPRRIAVIHAASQAGVAQGIAAAIDVAGPRALLLAVPDGEQAKTATVAADCWAALGRFGLTRSDAVVGVGGGATTDLAGFVAATFLRGVAVAQVPTTLLGMVDAAVGGKTGINTAEGKNLVGAFHEPIGVICDLDRLDTLPRRELASGLAEVIKCGFIADQAILEVVADDPARVLDPRSPQLRGLVERAIGVKAAVVAGDLREATSNGAAVGRESLNYGHTLGHAIERVDDYALRHGEAVSVGLVFAAELANRLGLLTRELVDAHRSALASVGLPIADVVEPSAADARWERLLAAMRVDKKARGDSLRFVLLDGLGHPVVVEAPPLDSVRAAYQAVVVTPDGIGSGA